MNLLVELRFAFYIAALSFVWLMLEFAVGLHDTLIEYHAVVTLLSVLIPAVFIYIGMRRKNDVFYDSSASWTQLFKTGMLITIFSAAMIIPMQAAFHYFINPNFFNAMIAHAIDRAVANNQDTNKARMEAEAYFNFKSYLLQSGLGMMLIGSLLTVIYSFVLRRKQIDTVAAPMPEPAPRTQGP